MTKTCPPTPAAPARDQFIPVRKSDVLSALCAQTGAQTGDFAQLCRMLSAIYHHTYYEQLERLRQDYYYFNPELSPPAKLDPAAIDAAYDDLEKALDGVLAGANFVAVSPEDIDRAHAERPTTRVAVRAERKDFRDVRLYRRGVRRETVKTPGWFGMGRKDVEIEIYGDVILFVAMKPASALTNKRDARRMARHKIRPNAVLIKCFRNIPRPDLNTLMPNVRVVMSNLDKLMLGVPAIAGGVPILLNLASTATVLFLVAGFYLGFVGTLQDDATAKAFAALSGVVALGGFLFQQWVKYQRQSLKYQKLLSDNLYFRNINNNAGTFDYLIGAAEDQECKEAFLAFYFLQAAETPLTSAALDGKIEAWLKETFAVDVEFDVSDALAKLERLGLLRRDGDALSVLPLREALLRLDRVWDDFFAVDAGAGAKDERAGQTLDVPG